MIHRTLRTTAKRMLASSLMVVVTAVMFGGMAGQANAQDDTAVVGSWKWMRDAGEDRIRCNLHIMEKDGKLVATYNDKKDSKAKVEKLKFEDGTLQFVLQMEDAKAQFKGEMKKGNISGKMKWGDELSDWKAVRFISLAEAASTWNLSFTTPDGVTREPAIKLTEKDGEPVVEFTGDEEDGQGEISNVNFEDGVLTFDVALEFNGADLKLEYDLEMDGDELEGTMYFEMDGGPSGDVEVTGERKK